MEPFAIVLFIGLYLYLIFKSTLKNRKKIAEARLQREFPGYVQINPVPTTSLLDLFLKSNFPFYSRLNQSNQNRFVSRMDVVLQKKYFLGKDGLEVHDEMILLICAHLVQITFGFNEFHLPQFERFVVFPDVFHSRLLNRNVKGLTIFHSGMVAISWPDAFNGHQIPNDKVNLILHELAHALYLDYFDNRSELYGFSGWKERALPEFERMQTIRNHPFLRQYAATNMDEFWAVCVEHFYEAPEEFCRHLPELYQAMCSILGIDPMKLNAEDWGEEYVFSNRPDF
jgi:Mlc titration factor MtfA (ptsG expression regulator)